MTKIHIKLFTAALAVVLIAGVATIFYACKKDENSSKQQNGTPAKAFQCSNVDIAFIENPYSIEQHITNPEDLDDEMLDRQLYEIALKAKFLFTNTDLNRFIIDKAGERANDCIDLRTFKEWPSVNTGKYPAKAVNELAATLQSTNLQYISKNPEVYGQMEHYIPALFVVNLENADPNKMPIFSPGIFVNEDLTNMESCEDCIIIWYFDKERNDFVEGVMSEEMALTTTHPIFIVDNACEEVTNRLKTDDMSGGKAVCTSNIPITEPMRRAYYSSNEYQINIGYEGVGKSEFCAVGVLIDENGANSRINSASNGIGWWLIDKVAKKDIGKLLSKWVTFCRPWDIYTPDVVPFECNYVIWNTFERDWARSPKPLGRATANGKTIYLDGNMKNNSNWYAYDPHDNSSSFNFAVNRLDLPYIFNKLV